MISSKIWQSLTLTSLVIIGATLNFSDRALANTELPEEKLSTEKSLRWGAEGLPFDEVVNIRNSLINVPVGKIVIDRHGEDNGPEERTGLLSGVFNAVTIRDPFAGPRPGRLTIVTLWGSKEDGCSVKAIVHNAPKGNGGSAQGFVPMQMEVGVGTKIVKLKPIVQSNPQIASGTYKYTENNREQTAPFYFADNTFAIDAKVAELFRNAPPGDARVRITFNNGQTKIFPIGSKNVARWRDAYSYNKTCKVNN